MTFGLFIIFMGVLFLLDNLGYIHGGLGRLIIPVIIISVGASLIIKGMIGSDSGKRKTRND